MSITVARVLRANQTRAERKLWIHLRPLKSEGFHFRRQAPIGRFVADFACHAAKLVIEVDGGQHSEDSEIEKDRRRTEWLAEEGYRVLRFWNEDVLRNIDGTLQAIRLELGLDDGA